MVGNLLKNQERNGWGLGEMPQPSFQAQPEGSAPVGCLGGPPAARKGGGAEL